jgi:mono/diheme cytochrome c family protein
MSMTKKYVGPTLAVAVMLVAVMNAGGWAVITVDDLPLRADAGKPMALTFTVRQHGVTPTSGLKPSIVAASGGTRFETAAAATPKEGQYAAAITLPSAGQWVLTIDSAFLGSKLTLLPVSVAQPGAAAPASIPADRGRQLFVAKGCVTCHQSDVGSSNVSMAVGPLLVPGKYQDDYLGRILANPTAMLPARQDGLKMPDLDLQPADISALVAFINKSGAARKSL